MKESMKKLIAYIDNTISKITMYRIVLYGLIGMTAISIVLSILGLVHFSAIGIIISTVVLLVVCYIVNKLFSVVFDAQSNYESWLITALILTLILPPVQTATGASLVALTGVIAISSKYLIAYRHRHIFNPAAFGALVLTATGLQPAIWWVGTPLLVIFTVILGIVLLRKLRLYTFFSYFALAAIIVAVVVGAMGGQPATIIIASLLLSSPLIFLGTIMLTEPETMPNGTKVKLFYALLVGALISSQLHIGSFYATPELALIIGNLFAFIIATGYFKQQVALKQKVEIGTHLHEYVFQTKRPIKFIPGQYREITLSHHGTDGRGNRRTFSIASGVHPHEIRFATKLFEKSSSFKTELDNLKTDDVVTIGQLNGSFILPQDTNKKLVWIAGGIGVTPFASMARDMVTRKVNRDVTLFYLVATADEYAYQDVWQQAKQYGLRVVPIMTGPVSNPAWKGLTGRLSPELVEKEVPDFRQRQFYLSGPHGLVLFFQKTLRHLSLKKSAIHSDFFSGY